MSSSYDTLNISPLRRGSELPMAEAEAALHPGDAEAARARIAALTEHTNLVDVSALPSAPTSSLVLDPAKLETSGPTGEAVKAPAGLGTPTRRRLPSAIKPLGTALGVFLLLLILLKSPVIFSQLQYAFSKPSASPAALAATSVVSADPTITIPKINVFAPVVYQQSIAEADVQKGLESGVVHYGNTPLPGQGGNSVIFGHSSNDWWEPGNYKFIFGLLDKLSPGDRFSVDYQSKRYIYEVTSTKVVSPTDVSVLNPTAEPTMTLITCTPPGTSLKRLIVVAKQIDPAPGAQVSATPAATTTQADLPGAPSGFFHQVGQAVSGIVNGIGSLFGLGGQVSPTPTPTTNATTELPAVK